MDAVLDYVSVQSLWTILLIIHGLASVALLGALTHQAITLLAPSARGRAGTGFTARLRATHAATYANAVALLWVVTFILGAWIYTRYRIDVRVPMEQEGFWKTVGAFELKEHVVTIGLGLLPLYALLWRSDLPGQGPIRGAITLVLAGLCWYAFLAGHVVNNTRGFGL